MYINKMDNNCKESTYDTGVTPGKDLMRHSNKELKSLLSQLTDDEVRKTKFPESNSMNDAGIMLADAATGSIDPAQGNHVALGDGKIKFINPPGLTQSYKLP